jgi:hypothetical protein
MKIRRELYDLSDNKYTKGSRGRSHQIPVLNTPDVFTAHRSLPFFGRHLPAHSLACFSHYDDALESEHISYQICHAYFPPIEQVMWISLIASLKSHKFSYDFNNKQNARNLLLSSPHQSFFPKEVLVTYSFNSVSAHQQSVSRHPSCNTK